VSLYIIVIYTDGVLNIDNAREIEQILHGTLITE